MNPDGTLNQVVSDIGQSDAMLVVNGFYEAANPK